MTDKTQQGRKRHGLTNENRGGMKEEVWEQRMREGER